MRTAILFTFLLSLTLQATAQQEEFNLAGISYTINPAVGLDNPANEQLKDVEIDLAEFRAFVLIPFRMNEDKTTLLGGVDYTFLGGPLDNLPEGRKVDANLHALRFTGGINQQLDDKWAFRAMLMPTIASDFSGSLTSDAFTLQASATVRHITRSGWRIGLGAAYTNGFGEPQLVPLGELGYRNDRFDLVVVAPIQMAFRYHFDDFFAGFRIDLQGNEYALSVDDERQNLPQIQSVKFSRYNIGPTFAWNMSDNLRIQLSGGVSVQRKLTATDIDNATEDYGLKNGAYLKAGIFFGNFERS